jgi:transposase
VLNATKATMPMRVGWFSIVHIKSTGSQELRMLLANRKILLVKQIDIENEIRGTLRVFWPEAFRPHPTARP